MVAHLSHRLVFVSLIVGVVVSCAPVEPPETLQPASDTATEGNPSLLESFEKAGEAAGREDWAAARDACLEGIELAPDVPALHLHAAGFLARLGEEDACRLHLEKAIRLGATADMSSDESFARVLEKPEFQHMAKRLIDNGDRTAKAEVVHRFADAELWPEGIAVDALTGDLYIGSIHRRAIYRLAPDGTAEEFGTSSQDGLMEVLGMWVDSDRRSLWAATGIGDYEEPIEDPPRENELVRYNLDTGVLDRRYPVPNDEIRLLNDVMVGPDGTVWATETLRGEVYQINPDGELELFGRFPDLVYLNGLAISGDGRRLYLGHYGGLSVLSPIDGSIDPVRGTDIALGMIDGMSWVDNRLVLVQNSRHVGFRTVRVDLDLDGRVAESLEVLPSGLPEGLIPYTCAVSGGDVFVVAGAPFGQMDEDAVPPAPAVVRMPLGQ